MNFFQKLGETLSVASKKTKKSIDKAKLELKLKGYHKEEAQLYCQIGQLFYSNHRNSIDDHTISALCIDIDNIKHRKLNIERLIQVINTQNSKPKEEPEKTNYLETKEPKYYKENFKLNKNDYDLTITRTEQGIQLLRFCPSCHLGNDPNVQQCEACGYSFTRD